jgi:hypothetical protein
MLPGFATAVQSVGDTLAEINTTASAHLDILFRRGPRFLDIVAYIGKGANRTIPHVLEVAPGFVAIKRRHNSGDWLLGIARCRLHPTTLS